MGQNPPQINTDDTDMNCKLLEPFIGTLDFS